jgi:hypothetical protein
LVGIVILGAAISMFSENLVGLNDTLASIEEGQIK